MTGLKRGAECRHVSRIASRSSGASTAGPQARRLAKRTPEAGSQRGATELPRKGVLVRGNTDKRRLLAQVDPQEAQMRYVFASMLVCLLAAFSGTPSAPAPSCTTAYQCEVQAYAGAGK